MKGLSALIVVTAFSVAMTGTQALAQSDGTYTLERSSITAGGVIGSNGQYRISGTAGQSGFTRSMTGGGYGFFPEFWWNSEPAQRDELIFRDSFEQR